MNNLTIALDAMGGDKSPLVVVEAAVLSAQSFPFVNFVLVGQRPLLESLLSQLYTSMPRTPAAIKDRIDIYHADDVISMYATPSIALRKRHGTSMYVALKLLQQNYVDACISRGNTGALMALSKHILKTLPFIERPALITPLPTQNQQPTYLLDIGANMACDSDHLYQFGLMGSVYVETMHQIQLPKVALLNIGTESNKGHDYLHQAAQKMERCSSIHFVGFVEGNHLFKGDVQVIVSDGFVGNVALKAAEGMSHLRIQQIHNASHSNKFLKLMLKFLNYDINYVTESMNPERFNGASFIGLKKTVVKSHGDAGVYAFKQAIEKTIFEYQRNVSLVMKQKIESTLEQMNHI
jgi:phosphate acyltransferase